jgi:hypothetical protein
MNGKIGKWNRLAATILIVAIACVANAAPLRAVDDGAWINAPDVAALIRFYPTHLSSTPAGAIEDRDVWLAKVQGLVAGAPPLLQQSVLASRSKQEFVSNIALLQQMQEGLLKQQALELQPHAAAGVAVPKLGSPSSTDLVYTPVTPCRIMDSRNASGASGVQGPLVGNTLYQLPGFVATGGSWGQYGGSGTDCGLND